MRKMARIWVVDKAPPWRDEGVVQSAKYASQLGMGSTASGGCAGTSRVSVGSPSASSVCGGARAEEIGSGSTAHVHKEDVNRAAA